MDEPRFVGCYEYYKVSMVERMPIVVWRHRDHVYLVSDRDAIGDLMANQGQWSQPSQPHHGMNVCWREHMEGEPFFWYTGDWHASLCERSLALIVSGQPINLTNAWWDIYKKVIP